MLGKNLVQFQSSLVAKNNIVSFKNNDNSIEAQFKVAKTAETKKEYGKALDIYTKAMPEIKENIGKDNKYYKLSMQASDFFFNLAIKLVGNTVSLARQGYNAAVKAKDDKLMQQTLAQLNKVDTIIGTETALFFKFSTPQ